MMSCAVAIFVKTPTLSPVKSRLWPAIGRRCAETLHLISAEAVASVAQAAQQRSRLTPYWAVAESEAVDDNTWVDLPCVSQGMGSLGERMSHVYRTLRKRHRGTMLIGADAPQIAPESLEAASRWLQSDEPRLVIGRAHDGGFWLFGGNVDLPEPAWTSPQYSASNTAAQFVRGMRDYGRGLELERVRDIDTADDIPHAAASLAAIKAPTAAQRRVSQWLATLPAGADTCDSIQRVALHEQ
jgi:glycosyltransferase A (GT-A) superfamily protein (DUF2064 family)